MNLSLCNLMELIQLSGPKYPSSCVHKEKNCQACTLQYIVIFIEDHGAAVETGRRAEQVKKGLWNSGFQDLEG